MAGPPTSNGVIPSRSDPGQGNAGVLGRRFLATFATIAGLLVLDQVVVQPGLLRLATDAPLLNVAGRQRMLSQRLAKAALALGSEADPAARGAYLAELSQVLALWSRSHRGLRFGDPALGLPGRNSPEVAAGLDRLEREFLRMSGAAGRLIDESESGEPDEATVREATREVLANEASYLERMDAIVGHYEGEARARVDRLRILGWVLAGLSLAVLAALGRFVVAPASRLIQRQMTELGAARDELDRRVRARTAELERVNARLEVEEAERRRAEERHRRLLEQLGRAARADAVGAMASGLAHELNQPLGAIANYAEGCLVALDAPEPPLGEIRGAVERVLAASIRAGQIIQRIRAFVTRREPAFEIVEPGRVAREVVEFCGEQARRRGVRLDLVVAPDLPFVRADPVQIQLVLVNLVTNALDALDAAQPERPHVLLEVTPGPDGDVEYRVSDNGEGIEPTQRDRIFDTFFSTRADGMGMGLAISRTIVEAHGGRIAAESEPGVGTTFRFHLPAAPDDDEIADGLPGGR